MIKPSVHCNVNDVRGIQLALRQNFVVVVRITLFDAIGRPPQAIVQFDVAGAPQIGNHEIWLDLRQQPHGHSQQILIAGWLRCKRGVQHFFEELEGFSQPNFWQPTQHNAI